MTGLYDHQGILRFTGRDRVECLEYAELFALGVESYCIASLERAESPAEDWVCGELLASRSAGG